MGLKDIKSDFKLPVISELRDQETYPKWHHLIHIHLKWFKLLQFITEDQDEPIRKEEEIKENF